MIEAGVKRIPVGKDTGVYAVVDAEDYERVAYRHWSLTVTPGGNMYAHTNTYDGTIGMHRFIMDCTDPLLVVDHRDGRGLNNRRSNLRVATYEENAINKCAGGRSKSGIPGVKWDERWRTWEVWIRVNGERRYIGANKSLEVAAQMKADAELEHHGDFARASAVDYVAMVRDRAAEISRLTKK